jgi:hypothetical protein
MCFVRLQAGPEITALRLGGGGGLLWPPNRLCVWLNKASCQHQEWPVAPVGARLSCATSFDMLSQAGSHVRLGCAVRWPGCAVPGGFNKAAQRVAAE